MKRKANKAISILALCTLIAAACSQPATPAPTSTPTLPVPTVAPTLTPTSTRVAAPTATMPAATTPMPTATATATPTPRTDPTPLDRDLYALTQRLVLKSQEPIARVVNAEPVSYDEGRTDRFHVTDILSREVYPVTATLWVVSEHAYWYVDDRVDFQLEELQKSAQVYEEQIYPRVVEVFGPELVPGVDNDVHLTILHTPLRGAAGYFSASDEYPVQVQLYSNQREMIYLDTSFSKFNTRGYFGTLAHELTHAIQFRADSTEDTWVSEGIAEIGKELAGYNSGFRGSFLATPSTSLTLWGDNPGSSIPNYGGASLFLDYLVQQYGAESMGFLMNEPTDSIAGVEAYLKSVGAGKTFRDVFADWIVANYLDPEGEGPYSYPDSRVSIAALDGVVPQTGLTGEVAQYGTRYYDLRPGVPNITVTFRGQDFTRILKDTPPGGGACWWSNRGDVIDSTMTTRITLPAGEPATLTYSLWYEIEEEWDYVYVEVSTDGGVTWDILETGLTSPTNPVGNAFGPGYTGSSNGWRQDTADLSPYQGKDVLVRFEYVTDDAIHGPGLCLRDIAVPEAGFFDDADSDKGVWETQGFIRTDNSVPQEYILRVIEVGDEFRVRDISLDADQAATFEIDGFGSRISHAVIVVAGVAEHTMLPARFTIETSPS